ncbi:UDP-3-O-acyl-N-acetylglucosamine deacetylase [Salinarimonas ramus]|uniref:UDP-3-O-acyl-N-acetylglucosamine deacetylase n=1 Tax=Salinarimonas ramus TaxID=690164 RepID=A0A917V3D4_9HYPH|nr:UDP-3-O-acyl-N-acetylglucosamine deacetylase [Salinarimonas ramus]GGK30093.1 UDP-3-O-acyl-N-acetylglucosamine deacetylase [Salinarimonas ramus]
MSQMHQVTLRAPVEISGVGVHSGESVSVTLHPAEPGHGIVFLRTGLPNGIDRLIEARHINVSATELCTVVGSRESGAVATIEHLMAALAGLAIDNVLVEIDGAEMPILDGSAAPFVAAIESVGTIAQAAPRRILKVRRPVRVEKGASFVELLPAEKGLKLDVEIDFADAAIGRQRRVCDLTPATFRREIAAARTFGFMRDVEALWKAGFALGASLENTVAVGEDGVINPEGLRFADEFARHKLLDAIGDLALAGYPLAATYRAHRGGHRLNFAVLEALFADRANYEIVEAGTRREPVEAILPLQVAAFGGRAG